jgi:hypothetical protein
LEFIGPESFAGLHNKLDKKELILIDVCVYKRGIVLPREFAKNFGHVRSAEVVYEGPYNREFVDAVKAGKYPVKEGVVAKGVEIGKKKNPQHGLWMSKVKTDAWLAELKNRAALSEEFRKAWEENQKEQE